MSLILRRTITFGVVFLLGAFMYCPPSIGQDSSKEPVEPPAASEDDAQSEAKPEKPKPKEETAEPTSEDREAKPEKPDAKDEKSNDEKPESKTEEPESKTEEPDAKDEKPEEASQPKPQAKPESKPKTEPNTESKPKLDADAARQAYEAKLGEWKDLLKELRAVQAKYSQAEDDQLAALAEQWNELIAKGEAKLDEVGQAAMEAYRASPNTDRQLTRFLVKFASDKVEHDEYESARELTQLLIQENCDDTSIFDVGGIAAFATNNFEEADIYFEKAASYGALSPRAQNMRIDVDEYKELWEREKQKREEEADDNLPRVRLKTTEGDVVVELFENEAPDTVGNFVSLVEKEFYDGLLFHRVIANFMAQTGCPKGDGTGGPGYDIYDECYKEDIRHHFRGSLSMAKEAARDTGGSQFFLTFVPTPHLNGKHTVFGRVIEGMEVLAKLERTGESDAAEPDKIIKAEVIRKKDHEYKPNKVS